MKLVGKPRATTETPIRDGFVVTQRHVTQGRRQQLIRECSAPKYDPATRERRDSLDAVALSRELIRDHVADWSGLTVPILQSLAPLNEGEELDVAVRENVNEVACNHTGTAFVDKAGLFGAPGASYTLPEYIYNRAHPEKFSRLLQAANDAMDEAEAVADEKKSDS